MSEVDPKKTTQLSSRDHLYRVWWQHTTHAKGYTKENKKTKQKQKQNKKQTENYSKISSGTWVINIR